MKRILLIGSFLATKATATSPACFLSCVNHLGVDGGQDGIIDEEQDSDEDDDDDEAELNARTPLGC